MSVQRLFDAHHDALYAYLARLTGDPDLAADIAQETFIRWVDRQPDQDNPRAWLYTVATNLARDHARVDGRRLVLLREGAESVPVGDMPPGPDHEVEADERRRAVRAALDALPVRDRTLLLMQQEGFTHREIAAAVGATTKSVGSLLGRAMRRFTERAGRDLEKLS